MTAEKTAMSASELTNNAKSASKRGALRWKAVAAILVGLIVLIASVVGVSQVWAHTPAITGPGGGDTSGTDS